MKYRADIDGLRALAVTAITIFHINKYLLPGGFVGVDIFFVISGFLITRHLLDELSEKKFSFSDFYIRRIRRLFPALFAMLAVTSVAAPFLLFPVEVEKYAQSLAYTAIYLSNFYFLGQSGYFESESEHSLLLHTWSLAVEEQFYIVFPFTLWVAYRYCRQRILTVVLAILIGSFVFSEYMVRTHPDAAFYISPSRFWQFMCGSIVAILPMTDSLSRTKREIIYGLGIFMVLFSIHWMMRSTPFPGIYAALPTLGTAFIIYAGNARNQNLLLSFPFQIWPSRLIGWASYSIYLWHWPIILFFKMNYNSQPDTRQQIALLVASIVAGIVSWLLIEKTTRSIKIKTLRAKSMVGIGVLVSIVLSVTYSYSVHHNVFGTPYPDKAVYFSNFLGYKTKDLYREETCFITDRSKTAAQYQEDTCIQISKKKRNILVFGDSHSAHLYAAAADVFRDAQVSQINASGCKPVLNPQGTEICKDIVNKFYQTYLDKYPFDLIIISARWKNEDLQGILDSVAYIKSKGRQVVVLGPVMEYDIELPRVLALAESGRGQPFVQQEMRKWKFDTDKAYQQAFDKQGFHYISLIRVMCPDGEKCLTQVNGVPLQFDYGHFTFDGAKFILQSLVAKKILK